MNLCENIVSSLKHKNTQPLYIFNRVRVLHLDRLKDGTWLHSFEHRCVTDWWTDLLLTFLTCSLSLCQGFQPLFWLLFWQQHHHFFYYLHHLKKSSKNHIFLNIRCFLSKLYFTPQKLKNQKCCPTNWSIDPLLVWWFCNFRHPWSPRGRQSSGVKHNLATSVTVL